MAIVRYWELVREQHAFLVGGWAIKNAAGHTVAVFSGDHADELSRLLVYAGPMANALEAAILYGAHHLNCRSKGVGIDGCTCWKRTASEAFDQVKVARTAATTPREGSRDDDR